MAARTHVFVSYAKEDQSWLERVRAHLRPLERDGEITVWADTQIAPGAEWRKAVHEQLDRTQVGIMLLSADFFASDFIAEVELPTLLGAAQDQRAVLLVVVVKPCGVERTPLGDFQAVNDVRAPLVGMSEAGAEDTLVRLTAAVRDATVSTPASLGPTRAGTLVYDSDAEPEPFARWMLISRADDPPDTYEWSLDRTVTMRAFADERIGVNKSLSVRSGTVEFEYQVIGPRAGGSHVYFAMIPMCDHPYGLLEVGAVRPADPRNARSPYRLRAFVPGDHYGDGDWHRGRMTFAFDGLPTADYSIFAARINEGVDQSGPAAVQVRSVKVWGP